MKTLLRWGSIAFAALFAAAPALAIETGLNATAGAAGLATGAPTLPVLVGRIIAASIGLVGVVFLVLMVYGGFLWMTARGDEQKVEKSKDLITAAVIGLIVVLAAYIITNFVVSNLLSATTAGGSP